MSLSVDYSPVYPDAEGVEDYSPAYADAEGMEDQLQVGFRIRFGAKLGHRALYLERREIFKIIK